MIKITVEGIYESDIGSGQKKYENFNYTFETARNTEKGLNTHIMRRFIPYFIYKDKNKKGIPFSRLKTFYINNIEKTSSENNLIGKDINTLNELEIQDLACMFDLYEVPLPLTCSISELREKATIAYMKKVLNIPMDSDKEKTALSFFKKQSDGTFKLDLGGNKVEVLIPDGYFEKEAEKKEVQQKDLDYFIKKANQINIVEKPNEIITDNLNLIPRNSNTENTNKNSENTNGSFPSASELMGKQ